MNPNKEPSKIDVPCTRRWYRRDDDKAGLMDYPSDDGGSAETGAMSNGKPLSLRRRQAQT